MKANIIKQMENVVNDYMTSYQSDFQNYDKTSLADFDGEFWWMVRKSGTSLAKFDHSQINNERFIYALMQGNTDADCIVKANICKEQLYFRYNGCPYELMKQVSKDDLERLLEQYKAWVLSMTNVEVPKRIKVRVLFSGEAEDRARLRAYLKEQLQYADSIGDTTLRDRLAIFHNRFQVCKNHVYYLNVDIFYGMERSFYFAEYIDGEYKSNGGILYDEKSKTWNGHT